MGERGDGDNCLFAETIDSLSWSTLEGEGQVGQVVRGEGGKVRAQTDTCPAPRSTFTHCGRALGAIEGGASIKGVGGGGGGWAGEVGTLDILKKKRRRKLHCIVSIRIVFQPAFNTT